MALISLYDVSIRFGGDPLLEQVTLHIEKGQRACLTGRNGCGKSTLLKIITGVLEPDEGRIERAPALRSAYLQQTVPDDIKGRVLDVVNDTTADGDDGFRAHAQSGAEAISRLGLDPEATFEQLSGGMKRRVLLARALASSPDVLLLDEPTNHLDIEAIEWLEAFLCRSLLTVLFVSHDRSFLRKTATRILDLDRGQISGWDCDYDTFLARKAQLLNDEAVQWERKAKRLTQEEAWIRKGIKARRTRNEGRVRALQALREQFRQRRQEEGQSKLNLQQASRSSTLVVKAEGVQFSYPGQSPLIRGLDLHISRGERVGIMGPNGSGKTTLLGLITGRLEPSAGWIRRGERLDIAYFDQLRHSLDPAKTIVENLTGDGAYVEIGGVRRHVYGYLQEFLFTPERARAPVGILSGGERNRLMLARLFMNPCNLLILDEPTNDLDLETLELLEEQLSQYEGTLLLVSHDRTFLNNVVTKMLVFEGDSQVGSYAGGYDDWLVQRKSVLPPSGEPVSESNTASIRRRSYRLSNRERQEMAGMEAAIHALEMEQEELLLAQQDAGFYRQSDEAIAAAQSRLQEVTEAIEAKMHRWAELETLVADGA